MIGPIGLVTGKGLFQRSDLVKVTVFLLWFLLWSGATAAGSSQQPEPSKSADIPPKSSESKEGERPSVEMDFEDVDIRDLVSYVSEVTGKNFIVGPNLKGRITLVFPHKVPIDEVFSVFLSVLEVHGYTTVKAGAMTKIVPSSGGARKGIGTNAAN